MAKEPGTHIGPYGVVGPPGAGGKPGPAVLVPGKGASAVWAMGLDVCAELEGGKP